MYAYLECESTLDTYKWPAWSVNRRIDYRHPATAMPQRQTLSPQGGAGNTMIIDELLAFASSRMNVVPFDVLVKLMSDFYADEVVEASKQVLFETAFSNRNEEPPHQYSHKRRGQDKKSKNIQDIISVFLELPPHVTPSYVAKDLSNLPPLNMNCFDVSALVKDIEALKLHVAVLHECF